MMKLLSAYKTIVMLQITTRRPGVTIGDRGRKKE